MSVINIAESLQQPSTTPSKYTLISHSEKLPSEIHLTSPSHVYWLLREDIIILLQIWQNVSTDRKWTATRKMKRGICSQIPTCEAITKKKKAPQSFPGSAIKFSIVELLDLPDVVNIDFSNCSAGMTSNCVSLIGVPDIMSYYSDCGFESVP